MISALPLIAAGLAGGLVVYLYFATRPSAYEEPADVYVGGRIRLQQVSGVRRRPLVLVAFGALLACVVFLAGSLSTLL